MNTLTKPSQKQLANIDILNIGLMLFSLFLAIKIPFSSFLIAYAFLGPLHYLTEISWLKQHNFYVKKKSDAFWLIAFAIIISAMALLSEIDSVKKNPWYIQYGNGFVSTLYLLGFALAVGSVVFSERKHLLWFLIAVSAVAVCIYNNNYYMLVFGVLLGTLLHVSLFTFAFVLFGALKNKSTTGYLSLLVYLVCILIIFTIPILKNEYQLGPTEFDIFMKAKFQNLHIALAANMNPTFRMPYDLVSKFALRLQFFIAFSYIYHYLNWFSKVDIIKWHKAPGNTFFYIIIAWIVSVSLYMYDYATGLFALIMLSVIHVFLEFPLNFITFKGIGNMLLKRNK